MRVDESLPNQHHVIIGTTGSGKTTFIKRHPYYRESKRVLVWDPEGTYHDLPRFETRSQFLRYVQKKGFGPVRARLEIDPTPENFEWFCQVCWELGHAKAPLTIVAEELADVVKPGKASKYWGFLARKSRKYGSKIIAVSQRPQEIDKTILNMRRFIWCGLLATPADQKYMAGIMALPIEQVAALEECEFYIRNGSKPSQPGRLLFNNPKAK